jgi:hypothetical protein
MIINLIWFLLIFEYWNVENILIQPISVLLSLDLFKVLQFFIQVSKYSDLGYWMTKSSIKTYYQKYFI